MERSDYETAVYFDPTYTNFNWEGMRYWVECKTADNALARVFEVSESEYWDWMQFNGYLHEDFKRGK